MFFIQSGVSTEKQTVRTYLHKFYQLMQ